jgi:hypothetical protein
MIGEKFFMVLELYISSIVDRKLNYVFKKLGYVWNRLVMRGGAERHRHTTRRYFEKVLEDVVERRISENIVHFCRNIS